MSTRRGTVHSIQFLRFVAATLVVVFHVYLAIALRRPGVSHADAYRLEFGAVGVHIFFVISGYIMYLTNFARPQPYSVGRFFSRRLIRIYPVYWIFCALYLTTEVMLAAQPPRSPEQLVGALALWGTDAAHIIGPAWTLAFEIYFYLVFGFVMLLGARRGAWTLTLGFGACIAAGLILRPSYGPAVLATNPLLLEFLAGVWIARITSIRVLPRALGWLGLAGALAGYGVTLAIGIHRLPSAIGWGVPSALLVAAAVVLEQTAAPSERRGPIRRLSVLGDSSYSLYLCHILLITLAGAALTATRTEPSQLGMTVALTLACIGFAHLFYLAIERRAVGALHRLIERPRAAARPAGDVAPAQR